MGLSRETRILSLLVIDTAFFFLELIVGYAVHSLALVADSFHMLNDVVSLIIAYWAVSLASRPAKATKYTYGWQRAEILGALVNGVFLVALCLTIFLEALQRLIDVPTITNPKLILIVGSAGLASNVIGLLLFHDHGHAHGGHSHGHSHDHQEEERSRTKDNSNDDLESVLPSNVVRNASRSARPSDLRRRSLSEEDDDIYVHPALNRQAIREHVQQANVEHEDGSDGPTERDALLPTDHSGHNHAAPKPKSSHPEGNLNMRGVFLHVLGDALGNVGVIATALFIWLTNYPWRFYFDPVVSIFITFVILHSAIPLCKSAALILLQVAPTSIDVEDVRADIAAVPGVINVHELHVWQLSDVKMIASVHVLVDLPQDSGEAYMAMTASIRHCLQEYGIHSCTIQPEFKGIVPFNVNGQRVLRRVNQEQSADSSSSPAAAACALEPLDGKGCCT